MGTQTVPPLHGRDAALRLVREFLTREERGQALHSRSYPIIVFTGMCGTGKSALFAHVARRLRQHVPCALVDCGSFPGGARELLSLVAFRLNRHSGRYGAIPFPRLVTGQLVIASELAIARPLTLADREAARGQVEQLLKDHQKTASRLQQAFTQVFAEGAEPIAEAHGVGPAGKIAIQAAGQLGPKLLLGRLVTTRHGRRILLGKGQQWYGHQDLGFDHDSLDVLVDLYCAATQPNNDADTRWVAKVLWAAFLADLRDSFAHSGRAIDWTLNCAVLLDNADAQAGQDFLNELVEARRLRAAYAADDPDPLTVIASSRGELAGQFTRQGESPTPLARASYADYRQRGTARASRWWYPVGLPSLTWDEVGKMVAAHELPAAIHERVCAAVYRFTGGHPYSVGVLLNALAEQPDIVADDPLAVLSALSPREPGKPRQTIAECLLARLLDGVPPDGVAALTLCSAARNQTAALQLSAASGLVDRGADEMIFGADLWETPATGGPSVLPGVLRRLLTRRLAGQDAGGAWDSAHGWLRESCQELGDEAGVLYHTLALGEVEPVARRLAELLPVTAVGTWLALFETVTAAPSRLDHDRAVGTLIGDLAGWAGKRDVPLAPAARLVAAAWLDSDPTTERHRPSLYREMHASLHEIAPHSKDGIAVLREYADKRYSSRAVYRADPAGEATAEPGALPGRDRPAGGDMFAPPRSQAGIRHRRLVRATAAVVAVVAIAGTGAATYGYLAGRHSGPVLCGAQPHPFQVVRDGSECVGVSDGSYLFDQGTSAVDRQIVTVERAIAAQNRSVLASKAKYMTVALLTPLTQAPGAPVSLTRIRDELQGAYAAQYAINVTRQLSPKVRLVLANEGSEEQAWQQVTRQLIKLQAPPDRLVAVAGMGVSVKQTFTGARVLSHAQIPMIGAIDTGDILDWRHVAGLARVSPGVGNEVTRIVGYLASHGGLPRADFVSDTTGGDLYTTGLASDFRADFRNHLGASLSYNRRSTTSQFSFLADTICARAHPTVIYAGREVLLSSFVSQLQQAPSCDGMKITVITGGDAIALPLGDTKVAAGQSQQPDPAKISILFTDLVNLSREEQSFRTFIGQRFGGQALTDSWTVEVYNSLMAAGWATSIALREQPPFPPPSLVRDIIHNLAQGFPVPGATGPFTFNRDGQIPDPDIPVDLDSAGTRTTLSR